MERERERGEMVEGNEAWSEMDEDDDEDDVDEVLNP